MAGIAAPTTSATSARARRFTRLDLLALACVTALAGALRADGLARPHGLVFDEVYYAEDACWYVHHARHLCGVAGETSFVHPPLAKWLIALGIELFGYDSLGWRIPAAVAGTLTVSLLYVLARILLGSTFGATLASGLLALDFLHFVSSRVATLDVFVTLFSVAAVLFAVLDRDDGRRERTIGRPWRIAAGVSAGAAVACKWSGVLALLTVVLLELAWARSDDAGERRAFLRAARAQAPSLVVWFLVAPVVVYTATYAGRLSGVTWLTAPWHFHSWPRTFLRRQHYMLGFQVGLSGTHPYESPAWSWLLDKRPVVYHFKVAGGRVREILALGNPLTWWSSIVACSAVAAAWLRRPSASSAEAVIVIGAACSYLPWLVLSHGRGFVFLYYVLPVVPFLCLALAWVAVALLARWAGRVLVAAFAAATVALFVFYYPILTARPIRFAAWHERLWFADCRTPRGSKAVFTRGKYVFPKPGPGKPPSGWCWI